MSIVAGFDVSSSTIGFGILSIDDSTKEITFVDAGYLKPIKDGSIVERIAHTRNQLLEIINKYSPDYIGIEDIIRFMGGKSSADTIIMLTTFNRMTCLLSYDYLKKEPQLFNVMTIRHGLKLNKILPKKEEMPELVAKHLGIIFPYKKNKKDKIIEESYDTADGIAVALYYAFVLTGKIMRKTIKAKINKLEVKKPKRVNK